MTIAEYDQLEAEEKKSVLRSCCASTCWIDNMIAEPPFEDLVNMLDTAESLWNECTPDDWKEAFQGHPRIGDLDALREKFPEARAEQAGVDENDVETLAQLAAANTQYEAKFGYTFIIFASGKSAAEMCTALTTRLNNDPDTELQIAADEQFKITRQRIEKLFL